MKIQEENNKGMITLDNVFELARNKNERKQDEGSENNSENEEEEDSDIDTPEEDNQEQEVIEETEGKKKRKPAKPLTNLDTTGTYLSPSSLSFLQHLPT